MPVIDDEEKEKEYLAILAIFERFWSERDGNEDPWEIMEELASLRADFAIHHAVKGFGMEWDDAIELVTSNLDELPEEQRNRAEILIAAINNLAEFAAAEEYQMMAETDDVYEESDEKDDDEKHELLVAVCQKYNSQYANTENLDIEYAMMIADALVVVRADASLMYMTQGDERVRPWHLQFEGFTAPKSRFPAWLIPPIEHQCRCFLVEVDDVEARVKIGGVQNNSLRAPEMPDWFNRTFKESVALGGRIFSDEHPYFQVNTEDVPRLSDVVERIRAKYLNG